MGHKGFQPRRRARGSAPPAEHLRERCACGMAIFDGPGDARGGLRRLQRSRRDKGGRLHTYRCDVRPGVWHVGHY
jgi:hypothetical protein